MTEQSPLERLIEIVCQDDYTAIGHKDNEEYRSLKQQIEKSVEFFDSLESKIKLLENNNKIFLQEFERLQQNQRTEQDKANQKLAQMVQEFWYCTHCHWLARLDKPSGDSILRICVRCQVALTPLHQTLQNLLAGVQ